MMSSQSTFDSWKCVKYRELKRSNKKIDGIISLGHDPSRQTLYVYHEGSEIDRVTYNTDIKRFPLLKVEGNNLFVRHNESGQGFRLTFENEQQRITFSRTMQHLTYISESPLKTFSQDQNSMFDMISRPTKQRYGSQPTRQLHYPMSQPSYPFSQPVYNPYAQNVGDFESGQSMSSWSSRMSVQSTDPFMTNMSQSTPMTPPVVVVQKEDKCIQTDSLLEANNLNTVSIVQTFEELKNNKSFIEMMRMFRKKDGKNETWVESVKNIVAEMNKCIDDEDDKSQDPFDDTHEILYLERRTSKRLAELKASREATRKKSSRKVSSRKSSDKARTSQQRPTYKSTIYKFSETQ